MKRTSKLLVAALAGVALVPVGSAPTAAAVKLSIGPLHDMVVDRAHGKVFMSGKTLAVANQSGSLLGTVGAVAAPKGMTLSANGSKLLVASGHAVVVIDAATSAVDATIALGDDVCPDRLAPVSGKVFFTYYACSGTKVQADQLGAVDLGTGTVSTALYSTVGGRILRKLALIPGQPAALAVLVDGGVVLVDTAGGTLPAASERTAIFADSSGWFSDLAVAPDGSRLVVGAFGSSFSGFKAYSTSSLSEVGSYPLTSPHDPSPRAVAFRADGTLAVAWEDTLDQYDYLRYYKPGSSTPFFEKQFGSELLGTIAFGSEYLYGVYKTSVNSATYLDVYFPGPPAKLTLTSAHTNYPWLSDVTVVATLGSPTKSRKIAIFARPAGSTERWIKSGYVSSTGQLKATLHDVKISTTFRAAFTNDGTYDSASASKTVKIAGKVTLTSASTSQSGNYHRLPASPTPTVLGKVYTGAADGCVTITGFQLYSSGWHRFDDICVPAPHSRTFSVDVRGFKPGARLKVVAQYISEVNGPSPTVTYYLLLT